MRARLLGLLALPALTLGACSLFRGSQPVVVSESSGEVASRWNASLATPPELAGALSVRGSAWMARDSGGTTRVHAAISNAAPDGVHPWHVHRGTCGSNGPIVGPADAYPPLRVGKDGRASADATLAIAPQSSVSYYVNVHASAANMNTIIACGNLAPPLR